MKGLKTAPSNEETKHSAGINMSACIIAGAFLFASASLFPARAAQFKPQITPLASLKLSSVDLTPAETRFFDTRSRTAAGKWMFEYQGLSGSMLVVHSGAVNGLHAPEICLLGNGISVDHMETQTSGDKNYRWLTVDNQRRTAVYWMQSQNAVTDDFRQRFKNYVMGGQADWIMVTILLDERLILPSNTEDMTPKNSTLLTFMDELQSHYSAALKDGDTSNAYE